MTTNHNTMSIKRRTKETIGLLTTASIGALMMLFSMFSYGAQKTAGATIQTVDRIRETAPSGTYMEPNLVETANTGFQIPLFADPLQAFLFIGGFALMIAAAYWDYSRNRRAESHE